MRLKLFAAALCAAWWCVPASAVDFVNGTAPTLTPTATGYSFVSGDYQCGANDPTPCAFDITFTLNGSASDAYGAMLLNSFVGSGIYNSGISSILWNGTDILGNPSSDCTNPNVLDPICTTYGDLGALPVNTLEFRGTAQGSVSNRAADWFSGIVVLSDSPVPEPTTWALMLLGFMGMAVALRHQRSSLSLR